MIIWTIFHEELQKEPKLSVSENTKTLRSISKQIFNLFFIYFSVSVSHFAADASGSSGGGMPATRASRQKPPSQREPHGVTTFCGCKWHN